MWIMCYNNCEYINNLYKNYNIIETSWKYGMNKTKESSEIIIISNELKEKLNIKLDKNIKNKEIVKEIIPKEKKKLKSNI